MSPIYNDSSLLLSNITRPVFVDIETVNHPQECFICFETTNNPSKVCNCNSVVHFDCQLKMINSVNSHALNCPICKQNYINAIGTKQTISLTKYAKDMIIIISFSTVFIFSGICILYYSFYIYNNYKFILLSFGLLMIVMPFNIFITVMSMIPHTTLLYKTQHVILSNNHLL